MRPSLKNVSRLFHLVNENSHNSRNAKSKIYKNMIAGKVSDLRGAKRPGCQVK